MQKLAVILAASEAPEVDAQRPGRTWIHKISTWNNHITKIKNFKFFNFWSHDFK